MKGLGQGGLELDFNNWHIHFRCTIVTSAVCLFLVGENLALNNILVRKYLLGQGSGLHVSESRPSQGCPPCFASIIIDLVCIPVPQVFVQSVQFDILQSTTSKKAYDKT